MPLRIHDKAVFIQLKLAVTAIDNLALVIQLKKALPANRHIQRVAGDTDITLTKLLSDGCHLRADAGCRVVGATLCCGIYIGKLCLGLFKASSIGIGYVIANHVEVLGCYI